VVASPLKSVAVNLVEYFVHPSLRAESDTLYRVRVLIALLLSFNILLFVACVLNQMAGLSRLDHIINLALTLVVTLGDTLLLINLRQRGSYSFCGGSAVLLITIAGSASIGISGGVTHSPVALLLAVPVLMAYFFRRYPLGHRPNAID
jgi:hypothetical protein